MKIVVAGAGGMLGHDVALAGARGGHELVLLTRANLDVTDAAAVQRAFAEHRPDAAINCAAWTDVDGAESHREQAFAVNATGAGNLARAAAGGSAAGGSAAGGRGKAGAVGEGDVADGAGADAAGGLGVPLIHVSTDYVFSGKPPKDAEGRQRAYTESDPTGPISVYGQSKLAGELEVLSASPLHTVVRSSWLFGIGGRNFADTMLWLAGERTAVAVVTDQVGCPTWTGHLAPALIGLVEREVHGLVHLAGAGAVSWNGFAAEIFRQADLACRVEPATSDEMSRPAPRPAWSALESERADIIPMPDWRDGLAGYLAARAGHSRQAQGAAGTPASGPMRRQG